jgi:hypothetical protein
MKRRTYFLWAILTASVIIDLLELVEIVVPGFPIERLFGSVSFLESYWFPVAICFWVVLLVLISLHSLVNSAISLPKRILWVLSFIIVGQLTIPIYCVIGLRQRI